VVTYYPTLDSVYHTYSTLA